MPREANNNSPLKLLYFSQISKEKGVKDIIKLVKLLEESQDIRYQLDFYGHIVPKFKIEFEEFIENAKNVKYNGVFDSTRDNLYKKINEYDLLLFPTHWKTEGVPGILVEAKMAGIAVIASDKSYNSEIIQVEKHEGFLIHENYAKEMYEIIDRLNSNRDYLLKVKKESSKSRKRYALEEYDSMIRRIIE